MADLKATLAERGARYGDFRDHAEASQALQRVIRNAMGPDKARELPDVVIEGVVMICHKLARIATGDPLYADNWHDIAGYATIVEERLPSPTPPSPIDNSSPDRRHAQAQRGNQVAQTSGHVTPQGPSHDANRQPADFPFSHGHTRRADNTPFPPFPGK